MFHSVGVFQCIPRPEGVTSCYSLLVVDVEGNPHLSLTQFYTTANHCLSQGTVRTYLNSLLPCFTYVATDEWRKQRGDQWDSPPEDVQQCVRDYLMYRLGCQVRPKETYALVSLTAQSPNTVHIFLSALKLFYTVMLQEGRYAYLHPLLDASTRLLHEVERKEGTGRYRMPQISGVEEPSMLYPSENVFRLKILTLAGNWFKASPKLASVFEIRLSCAWRSKQEHAFEKSSNSPSGTGGRLAVTRKYVH